MLSGVDCSGMLRRFGVIHPLIADKRVRLRIASSHEPRRWRCDGGGELSSLRGSGAGAVSTEVLQTLDCDELGVLKALDELSPVAHAVRIGLLC